MLKIWYVTENEYKFERAKRYAEPFGIDLLQKELDIEEIQSDSIDEVACDKARKAFKFLKKPLVVSDSGWNIPSLNGFPGPYMHYINEWFNPEDFLRLMEDKKDRSIILEFVICLVFEGDFKLFKKEIEGIVTNQVRGESLSSLDKVMKLGSSDYTVAEAHDLGRDSVNDADLWEKVYEWWVSHQ